MLVAVLFLIKPLYKQGLSIYNFVRLQQAAVKTLSALTHERVQILILDSRRLAEQSHTEDSVNFYRSEGVPIEFSDLDPTWVSIVPNQVMIELVGGFDHRGIVIRKDETGAWIAYCYNEDSEKVIK